MMRVVDGSFIQSKLDIKAKKAPTMTVNVTKNAVGDIV